MTIYHSAYDSYGKQEDLEEDFFNLLFKEQMKYSSQSCSFNRINRQMRVGVCVRYLQILNIHRASSDCEPDRLPPHLMIRVSAHCHQGGNCV